MSNTSIDDFQLYNGAALGGPDQRLVPDRGHQPRRVPTTTPVRVAAGAILDLNGVSQRGCLVVRHKRQRRDGAERQHRHGVHLDPQRHGGTTTFSGNIAGGSGLGTLSLVMSGSGVQVLAGTNTYTGGTDVTGGTLDFAGPSATPSTVSCRSSPAAMWCWAGCWGPRRLRPPPAKPSRSKRRPTAAVWRRPAATPATLDSTWPLGDDAAGGTAASAGTASVPEPAAMVLLLAGAAAGRRGLEAEGGNKGTFYFSPMNRHSAYRKDA